MTQGATGAGPVEEEVGVDQEACMGSGNCVFWAPEVFDLDDDGVAFVRGDPVGHEEGVRRAAANCPGAAITVGRSVHR